MLLCCDYYYKTLKDYTINLCYEIYLKTHFFLQKNRTSSLQLVSYTHVLDRLFTINICYLTWLNLLVLYLESYVQSENIFIFGLIANFKYKFVTQVTNCSTLRLN